MPLYRIPVRIEGTVLVEARDAAAAAYEIPAQTSMLGGARVRKPTVVATGEPTEVHEHVLAPKSVRTRFRWILGIR